MFHFEGIEREKARERLSKAGKEKGCAKFAQAEKGKSREKAAAVTGYSHETLRKAKAVVEAAKREPGSSSIGAGFFVSILIKEKSFDFT